MYFRFLKINFPFTKGEGKRRKVSFPSTVNNFWATFRSPRYSFIASFDAKNELTYDAKNELKMSSDHSLSPGSEKLPSRTQVTAKYTPSFSVYFLGAGERISN